MVEICCGVASKSEATMPCEPSSSSQSARQRRIEVRRLKFVSDMVPFEVDENERPKRQTLEESRNCENAAEKCVLNQEVNVENGRSKTVVPTECLSPLSLDPKPSPKYGVASICGRRRDMEDAVAVHPSFLRQNNATATFGLHYFGVYDGHGCSHVAMRCRDRLHELLKEELVNNNDEETTEWKGAMERSFTRMDKEVTALNDHEVVKATCRCELQTPECDAVGSTAVVAIVTHDKIVIANCGDSRAVLSRNRKALPLSSDHKPDRPDELNRIQEAGGRVIYWDGPRVLGVLAMSRAIGDNYLKPYVSCEPEVTVLDRTAEDECLILATDGLWDVVSNETACGVARMCLRRPPLIQPDNSSSSNGSGEMNHKSCADASLLLAKLALARHSTDNVSVAVVDLRKPAT